MKCQLRLVIFCLVAVFAGAAFGGVPLEVPEALSSKLSPELPVVPKPWSQVYRETKESIVVIFSSGRICSGALVDKDLVFTAAHCVSNLREAFVFLNENYDERLEANIVAFERSSDLALLRLKTPVSGRTLPIAMKATIPVIGDEIVTIGHPASPLYFEYPPFDKESTYLLSRGVVSQLNDRVLISDLSVSPGNSGGPVLNTSGEIVGVVSKKRIDRGVGNIAHIVAPRVVQQFYLQNRDKRNNVSLLGAQTDLDFYVWYNHWSAPPRDQSRSEENFESELALSFCDRLTLGSMFWFGGDIKRESTLFLGWKFQWTTPSLTLWTLTPGLVQWHDQDGIKRNGLSLYVDHTNMPLSVKLTAADNHGKTDFIWSLGLKFF